MAALLRKLAVAVAKGQVLATAPPLRPYNERPASMVRATDGDGGQGERR